MGATHVNTRVRSLLGLDNSDLTYGLEYIPNA